MTDSSACSPGPHYETPLEIVPHLGMLPIQLGMTRADVAAALGSPQSDRPSRSSYGGLQINYDASGHVQQLGLSWNPTGKGPDGRYKDIMVFDTAADDLVDLLRRETGEQPLVAERGSTVAFYSIDLSLWRPTTPDDYRPDDPEDEYRKGRYWMEVALHRPGLLRQAGLKPDATNLERQAER